MTVSLAVLGDSIAFGQGTRTADEAIGPRLAAALSRAGTPTRVSVFAVPGARSAALAAQVHAAGRPDVALVVIGANDVTHFVPADQAAELLAQAVRTLRARGVQVVVVPAPDLSAVPFVPVQFRGLARQVSVALRAAQTREALRGGARVVDVDALSGHFTADPELFSADRFHPSGKGYELIARALLPAVTAAVTDALDAAADEDSA